MHWLLTVKVQAGPTGQRVRPTGTQPTSAASRYTGLENSRLSSAGMHVHSAEPFILQPWQWTRAVRQFALLWFLYLIMIHLLDYFKIMMCPGIGFQLLVCVCVYALKLFSFCFKVRTSPPSHLSRGWRRNKLCLKWEAPLPILFAHLQYEVCYQIRGTDAWTVSIYVDSWHFIFFFPRLILKYVWLSFSVVPLEGTAWCIRLIPIRSQRFI